MHLNKLASEIIRGKGLPYYERLVKVDRDYYNWHKCRICSEYVRGTCLRCKNSGRAVKPIGSIGDVWPTEITFPLDVIDLEDEHDNIIKAWRIYKGLSVEEFAKLARISITEVAQIEARGFKANSLRCYARALGVTVEQLT